MYTVNKASLRNIKVTMIFFQIGNYQTVHMLQGVTLVIIYLLNFTVRTICTSKIYNKNNIDVAKYSKEIKIHIDTRSSRNYNLSLSGYKLKHSESIDESNINPLSAPTNFEDA